MTIWRTRRVTVRPVPIAESDTFAAYRSPRVDPVPGLDAPRAGAWYLAAVEVDDAERVGELLVGVDPDGGAAEIGYHVHARYEGRGIATETAALAVERLVADHGIVRVYASVVPGNVASMRVLESIGMRFEHVASLGVWDEGTRQDGVRFAMTSEDLAAWRARPTSAPAEVSLVEIGPGDAHDWRELSVHHTQRRFVSSVDDSYADALFPEAHEGVAAVPWIRGVAADGRRAGFVMVSLTNGNDGGWYLWRLLIDRMHQRRGVGARAVGLVVDEARRAGVDRLYTSYVDERGGPKPFYARLGFERTGRTVGGEVETLLRL